MPCGISVPQPGVEPTPPALEARNLNHWIAREVLRWDSERRPFLSSVLEAGWGLGGRQPHCIMLSAVLGLPASRLEGRDGVGWGGGGLEPVTQRALAPSDGSSDEWQRCVMTPVLKRSLFDHHSLTAEKCCREGPAAQGPAAFKAGLTAATGASQLPRSRLELRAREVPAEASSLCFPLTGPVLWRLGPKPDFGDQSE